MFGFNEGDKLGFWYGKVLVGTLRFIYRQPLDKYDGMELGYLEYSADSNRDR